MAQLGESVSPSKTVELAPPAGGRVDGDDASDATVTLMVVSTLPACAALFVSVVCGSGNTVGSRRRVRLLRP